MMITGEHSSLYIEGNEIKIGQKTGVQKIETEQENTIAPIASSDDPTLSPDQIALLQEQLLKEEQELAQKNQRPAAESSENIQNSGSFVHPETSQSLQVVHPPQQKSQLPLILAVVVLLMGMYFFTQQNTQQTQPVTPIQEVKTVSVDLDSEPTGAEIYKSGSLIGNTPQSFNLKMDEAMNLVLKKKALKIERSRLLQTFQNQ